MSYLIQDPTFQPFLDFLESQKKEERLSVLDLVKDLLSLELVMDLNLRQTRPCGLLVTT